VEGRSAEGDGHDGVEHLPDGIDPKRMNESYGRFAWIKDCDGNRAELWQPLDEGA
jgi:hypothetical protein